MIRNPKAKKKIVEIIKYASRLRSFLLNKLTIFCLLIDFIVSILNASIANNSYDRFFSYLTIMNMTFNKVVVVLAT
jgi:hypothetical protein